MREDTQAHPTDGRSAQTSAERGMQEPCRTHRAVLPGRERHDFFNRRILSDGSGVRPVMPCPRLRSLHTKKRAVDAIYTYLAGGQYRDHIECVAEHLTDIELLFHKEVKSHEKVWHDRLKHYRGITSGVAAVHDRLRLLISPATDENRVRPAEVGRLLPKFAPIGIRK